MEKLKDCLLKDDIIHKFDTQYGAQIAPAGNHRIKILEWMHSLIYLKDDRICQKFQEIQLPKVLLLLMKKYDMNSLLHLKCYNIFSEAVGLDTDLWAETVKYFT